jgi:hypothetical protein
MSDLPLVKGIKIMLAGEERIVPPLALGPLEMLQDRISKVTNLASGDGVKLVLDVAFYAMRRNYPDITREDIGEMVGLENLDDIMKAALDAGGVWRKELEANALGELPPLPS